MNYTKSCRNCEHAYLESCKGCSTFGDNAYENFELREELAKIESGRLVELPCKVDDMVYCLIATGSYGTLLTMGKSFSRKVDKIIYDGKRFEIYSKEVSYQYGDGGCNFYGYWNDTVFATKEAAEAKLAELRGEE